MSSGAGYGSVCILLILFVVARRRSRRGNLGGGGFILKDSPRRILLPPPGFRIKYGMTGFVIASPSGLRRGSSDGSTESPRGVTRTELSRTLNSG